MAQLASRTADDVVELLEGVQAQPGHARRQTIGVMLPNDGSRFAARAGTQIGFFQQHHAPDTTLRQMKGDARADHATADNQEIAGNRHAMLSFR
jgi:hypothetical protein